MPVHGRCIALHPPAITLRSEAGSVELVPSGGDPVALGDIVEVGDDGRARVLTPARSREPGRWLRRVLDPRRQRGLETRTRVEAGIREHFLSQGFREVRTPIVVTCPGLEPHIRPFAVGDRYLHTSPELAMKRLLVGGLEKIFQICPVFRDEPNAVTHRPEFTMLEWYRAYASDEDIMRDAEQMVARLAPHVVYQGRRISLEPPWPRLRVRDLFQEHAGVDLGHASAGDLEAACRRLGVHAAAGDGWDDLYFRLWLAVVEPRLPAERAVFVCRYPASQAALSVVDTDDDGTPWARRFEIYAGGLELANAFYELTDPVEQRRRFVADQELRARLQGEVTPLDEEFLEALEEGMPPSAGIALGVNRLVMLLADEPDIAYTAWL